MTEEEPEVESVHYVGFWARSLAFVFDNIIGFVITIPLMAYISIDLDKLTDVNYVEELRFKLYMALLVTALVIIGCWKYLAATPGKLLLKSYIVNASDLTEASNVQLVVRAIAYIPSFFIFGLGFLWIAIDRRKQDWHDKIARTVVVYQKPRSTND